MTIFVAGAHGVGKTHLARPAADCSGLEYSSASELIRGELGQAQWDNERRVDGVEENQAALVRAVTRRCANGARLLLDGHFVLRRSAGVHEPVPMNVFQGLGVRGVLVVTADPVVVIGRLRGRGDQSWTEEEVAALMDRELRAAEAVSAELRVPLMTVWNPTSVEFEASLHRLVELSNWH